MGLFNYLKKKRQAATAGHPPCPIDKNTTCLLVMDRVMQDVSQAASLVEGAFGSEVLGKIEQNKYAETHMAVKLEGEEFSCSYMSHSVPPEEIAVPDTSQYTLFDEEEGRAILTENKSYWIIEHSGSGESLEEKRRVCCLLSRLAGTLLELEGALGIYVESAELIISRRVYLQYIAIMEKNREDPEFFPALLWVAMRQGRKGKYLLMGTWGLRQFGFWELWFLDPQSHWAEIHEKLYLMSIFQITGKEYYKDGDTIAFTEGNITTFKEMRGALFLVGGNV